MKSEDTVAVRRKGEIHFGKKATEMLGISGWKWLGVQIEGDLILMRICKSSPMEIGDHLIQLREKSSGLRGACLRFTEKIDFGDYDSLDLQFTVVSKDNESVLLRIDRSGFIAEEATECKERDEASKEVVDKDAQAKVARWIMANGCDEVSCKGIEGNGRFDGVVCPLSGSSGRCGRAKLKENVTAENWLSSNGYALDHETPLGTVSKPSEQQLDIFNLPGSKAGRSPRTRPLPEGLPEWLRGPLSRGEQVRVVAFKIKGNSSNEGWASGAEVDTIFGKDRPVAIVRLDCRAEPSFIFVEAIKPWLPCLKPSAECLAVAKELRVGLSPMQIEAIINGGVPPEGHGLPDEMFE